MEATRAHAREYETIYILRPDVTPDDADKAQARIAEVIQRLGGQLVKIDQWGKRKLAYKVSRQKKGIYVVLKYVGYSDLVLELERNLRMTDTVIKHQTVLLNDDVDARAVTVDAEAVQWKRLEQVPDEPEEMAAPPPSDDALEESDELSAVPTIAPTPKVVSPAPAPAATETPDAEKSEKGDE